MIRPDLVTVFMAMVDCLTFRGMCRRLKVACIIVRDKRIITSGINGPNTWDCDELSCDINQPCLHAIHAEENAIMFARKHHIHLEGTTLYCSHQPCLTCSELIIQEKITEVIYSEPYRLTEGLDLLILNNIHVSQFTPR